jgi:small membrane protein
MFQQIIALIIISFFLSRLFWQKQKKQIGINEFIFWLIFWLFAACAIIFLKWLDKLVANLGFSSSGIDILIYISVVILFYLIFKLRLKIEKIEKNITKIIKNIAINNKDKE